MRNFLDMFLSSSSINQNETKNSSLLSTTFSILSNGNDVSFDCSICYACYDDDKNMPIIICPNQHYYCLQCTK